MNPYIKKHKYAYAAFNKRITIVTPELVAWRFEGRLTPWSALSVVTGYARATCSPDTCTSTPACPIQYIGLRGLSAANS